MDILQTLRVALMALKRNKTRALLTTLGIIVGIAAVIAMMAIGQGATSAIQSQVQSMGSNLVIIFPGSMKTGGFNAGAGTQRTLTADDATAILQECQGVRAVTPSVRANGQIVYHDKNTGTSIQGVGASYPDVRDWQVDEGVFFSEADVRNAARICLLGRTVAKTLFDEPSEAIGQTIRIRSMPFTVTGLLTAKGSAAWGQDQDDTILAPWTTVRRVLMRSSFSNVDQILISLETMETLDTSKEEITALLRQRHRVPADQENDFTITDMTEVAQTITQVSRVMTILLTTIASISLLVGGIGIMNIMLVSVTERTREIGLRMAVGARQKDILLQFLVESIVLASVGGLIGILFGVGGALIISNFVGWPILISPFSIFLSIGFSGAVGIFFGFYPAHRASRLDPIEALRYE